MNNSVKTFTLFSRPYLDKINQCYKNIITINNIPKGPLSQYIKKIQFPQLSPFKVSSPCSPIDKCGYALTKIDNHCFSNCGDNLLTTDDVPDLISYLMTNGYKVDTSITKMFNASDIRFNTNNANKLICFVTYEN
jgi:hypothetical protein